MSIDFTDGLIIKQQEFHGQFARWPAGEHGETWAWKDSDAAVSLALTTAPQHRPGALCQDQPFALRARKLSGMCKAVTRADPFSRNTRMQRESSDLAHQVNECSPAQSLK